MPPDLATPEPDALPSPGRRQNALSLGLAAVVIIVGSLGALSWWSARAERDALAAARDEQLHALAPLLARNLGQMLADGELSAARRTIVEVGRDWNLSVCRLEVGDGQILADANPRKINVRLLPDHWAATLSDRPTPGPITRSVAVPVAGRGVARLELAPAQAPAPHWETQAGVGLIGASMLALLLLVYRRAMLRTRPLWLIRDALVSVAAGESRPERLEIDPDLGVESKGWNRLVGEVKRLRERSRGEVVAEALAPHRRASSELDAAFDVMSNGLLLMDETLKVRFANGAASVYLGKSREQIIGTDIAQVVDEPAVVAAVREVAAGGAQGSKVVEVKSDAEHPTILRFGVRPMRKGDTSAAMLVIEDVTQQRIADEARNSFVTQIAHELRTPLTNIRLYVESAIEDGDADPARRTDALNVINQESRRLERMIGEMLSISEIEAGGMRIGKDDVHLDALLREAQADFDAQAREKGLTFEFLLPPKMPVIQGDRDKLALAVHNLIGNAIKYTPSGGVTVRVVADRRKLDVEIADTGIGIKPEEAERVFERFYRAQDERVSKITGTGLGLTLAREVARLHGGDVTVESQVGKGSTFTLTLPVPETGEE